MRLAREAAGLSVDEMARYCGVSRQTIGNYEHDRGKRTVPRSVLRDYARRCDVPLRWLEAEETILHPSTEVTPDGESFIASVSLPPWPAGNRPPLGTSDPNGWAWAS